MTDTTPTEGTAPDELEALVDAVVDRMRWAYSRPGDPMEPARLRRQAEEVVDLLAARPAPTVNAAQVEAMSRYLVGWAGDVEDEWAGAWREAVTDALRAAGLTVADEGRADA